MHVDDREHLTDVLNASRELAGYVGDRTGAELEHDRMRFLAVVRLLEVIGEAANSVSESFRGAHPEIPWRQMIATRNRLIHGYRDVDPVLVAGIAQKNLPIVIDALEQILR